MSNMSDQTTKQSKKTRLIIGEVGVDTETGIVGKGHSYDNGKTFTVDDTIYGRIYHANDHGKIWEGIQDQVVKVVAPAKSAADSAVNAADAAVASAQVTSYAVSAIASATAEAKQGANEAMSRAKSAWDVATGAKEAVTDFDPLLKSAQSDAGKALTKIADTANALSDAKTSFGSDVAEAKQLASTAQTTADSAVKSASSVADDLTTVANQAKANSNGITKVTSAVGSLQTVVADNSGNISTIQETAKQIQQAVSDNAGNITVAKQTADSAVAVASDARSNATVAIQTASQASITAKNASGQAASAVLTANGAMTTASNAKSDATVAIQTASGASLTAINANSDATVAKQTASEAKVQASNAESDFAQLSIRAGKIEASVANNSGAIASVQQTANGLTTTVGNVDDRVKKIEDTTNWTTKTGALDMDTLTTTQNIYYRDTNLKNADGEAGWAYIQVVSTGERVTQTVWHDRSSIQHTRTGAVSGSSYNWDAWNKTATYAQVAEVKQTVDGITTIINDPKTGLNVTYQTAAGNANTISNVKGDVAQLQTTANGLTSRVGNLESKTNTQQTTIDQNKAAIALKADQTAVDTLKGTVSQNTATLKTQADQIQAKVSASDVSGMLKGYATQDYTQSLVTQKADQWNLNLTKLQTNVNAIKTTGGGVNLQQGTGDCSLPISGNGTNVTIEKFDDYTNMIHASGNSSGFYIGYTSGRFIPEVGKTYTFSCDIKGQGQISGGGLRYEGGDDGTMGAITLTDNWTRISNTIHVNAISGTWVIYLNPINGKVDFYVKHIMIEEGIVAHPWSPAPSDMATVTSVTNLSATVDGIQSQVYNSDGSSKITQLSNVIQTKVGTDDFNNLKQSVGLQTLDSADINNMKTNGHYFVHNLANNPIGGWVYVDVTGDGSSRIRQDVYQDNGTKHKYRRWYNAYWTGWEEGATYTEINQLQDAINLRVTKGDLISQINLQAGTSLIQSNKLVLDATTTVITGDAFIPSTAIANLTADQVQAGTLKGVKVDFRDSTGTGMIADGSTLTFDVSNTSAGYLSYNGMPVAEIPDGSGGNELAIRYGLSTAIIPNDNSGAQATFSKAAQKIAYMTGTDQGKRMLSGLEVHSDNHHWLGAVNSDATYNRIEINSNDGVNLTWHDNTHFWISDGNAKLYKDNDDGQTATKLEVHGWAWVNGWVEAAGHSQHSTLSSKTRIEEADPDHMLDLVNNTDLTTFAFKSEVAEGVEVRHIGPIIDDVNDVAQYRTPAEFIAPTKTARDDDNMLGALFGAVQALTKRIKKLEDKLNG